MANINDISLPPNIKDGTIAALVYRLGTVDPKMPAKKMHEAVLRKFGGTSISTIYALRASFGFRERGKQTPPNAKSAAPQRLSAGSENELHFRRLVARIGTDRAAQLLEQATQREID